VRARGGLLGLVAAIACSPLAAGIRVDIDGVEGELRRNVEAFLSVQRYRERDGLEADVVNRLFNRVDDEIRAALRPLGFYEPVIRSTLEQPGNDQWVVRIEVQPGPAVVLETTVVEVEGPGADEPFFRDALARLPLARGGRLNHGAYEQAKGDLQRTAAAYGYLDARLLENELLVDLATHRAHVRLRLWSGARYRFGAVQIDQTVIRPALMQRFMRFREGEPFSSAQLLRTQFALDDSLYFSTVEVLPLERDPQTLTVPVRITAEKSRRQFSLGGGYGTDTGVRGTFTWVDTRINDRGHRLRLDLKASAITRRLDARYDVPTGDPALEKYSLQLTNRSEEISDLATREFSLTPSLTQVRGRWQRVLSIAATRTRTDDGEDRRTEQLLVPGISYASVPEGYLGETLFTRAFIAELIGSTGLLGSDADFLRLHLQAERVQDLTPRWHLLLRGELGASLTRDFDRLPGIYRFFAGGDRSVRGFGYNELSPTAQITLRDGTTAERSVGGRHLLVGSVEISRDLPRNFGAAAFVDAGNAIDNFGDRLHYAAGVGLRYRLPVVAIGLDIAQPLSTSGSPRLHLNISPRL
jgi:translocation and assembly module TamA